MLEGVAPRESSESHHDFAGAVSGALGASRGGDHPWVAGLGSALPDLVPGDGCQEPACYLALLGPDKHDQILDFLLFSEYDQILDFLLFSVL